ncbi:MAG: beta-glucosidase [Pseudomonadota bacterium]|nr:beta-glucosidase [Pseudomonadota bacterium]
MEWSHDRRRAGPGVMTAPGTFDSFLLAGYECSSHRRNDGRRLDLSTSTGHARWVQSDYRQLAASGIRSVRDGLRWHLIETRAGHYDWSSFLPMLRAAKACNLQVIWDLCHYGYPDDLDIWRPAFVERFARFCAAVARLVREEGIAVPFYSPLNEISFWSWAGGAVGYFNPSAQGRGLELKHQLVRASIAAIEAIREQASAARFVQCEPLINVIAGSHRIDQVNAAEDYRQSQFDAWELLTGRQWPGLGGQESYLDIIGINYYPHNQWILNGPKIPRDAPRYRPLAGMLSEVHQRYRRPMFISETGAEGEERVPWLAYVSEQVELAIRRGVPIEGICWYPILDYPGWDNDRYCPAGLFGYADGEGQRAAFHPLGLAMQQLAQRFTPPGADDHGP